jgi:hypothetical protein
MKLAPRIVSAALAAAIAIAVPFVTPAKPADAAEPTDVFVKLIKWNDTIEVGLNAIDTPVFQIVNNKNSAGNSGILTITTTCHYLTTQGMKAVPLANSPAYHSNLAPGQSLNRHPKCGMYQGQKPKMVKVHVKAANEAAAQINAYNSATVNY